MLAAAILSAGESRRMGTPKALLPYHGRTFIEHLLEVMRHPRIGIVRVVLGAGAEIIRPHLPVPDSAVVINPDWKQGQLSSIHAAIKNVPRSGTEGMIVSPVDHPLITSELIARLIEAFDSSGQAIVLPTYNGRRGHPVIFRATLYDELLEASPEFGARQVVWAHRNEVVELPTDEEGIILNLNDPDSLRRAMR